MKEAARSWKETADCPIDGPGLAEMKHAGVPKLTVVIPCFNEERTIADCVESVRDLQGTNLSIEIIIVDDCSTDRSLQIARALENRYCEVRVLLHQKNCGKGAALRTGFREATGDFVGIQDADLEYRPSELRKLLEPLVSGEADVVFGSRFSSAGAHRVFYFWHFMGNKFLTFLSNIFTDLNLTDIEACYKVFRREVIKQIEIEENRFGFEPEIVAKVAHMRLRIYETGISYYGRTYAEGKKVGITDGFRAIYCILHYNAFRAPVFLQFLIYMFISGFASAFQLIALSGAMSLGFGTKIAAPAAFILAAALDYLLCIALLFRHKARWNSMSEWTLYGLVAGAVCLVDIGCTKFLTIAGVSLAGVKISAALIGLFLNFAGRRFLVFPETAGGSWKSARLNVIPHPQRRTGATKETAHEPA